MAPFVVAVSGTSGAGKSTLVAGLAAAVAGTGRTVLCLHFDDYAADSAFPADLDTWVRGGADPDAWRTDRFVDDLLAQRQTPEPGRVILVEEPFGRARTAMRPLIDLALHIDLPSGMSLARRLRRDFVPEGGEPAWPEVDRLRDYLDRYLTGGGAAYQAIDDLARRSSDVVLDGLRDPADLVEEAWRVVEQRLRLAPT